MTDDQMAMVAKALSHPARIRIVRLLAAQSECRGKDVFSELPLAQSTISEHLRILKAAGLVQAHRAGTEMVYCLATSLLDKFTGEINQVALPTTCCPPKKGAC